MAIQELAKSTIESKAKQALLFPPFRAINLEHIKAKVQETLGMIGKGNIFNEYTKHDISHINKMFELLHWLIPSESQNKMSPADYLMLT